MREQCSFCDHKRDSSDVFVKSTFNKKVYICDTCLTKCNFLVAKQRSMQPRLLKKRVA